ncbi:MAG: hypothetical protein AB7Y46_03170 [Armatimonadota bacterium]
MRLSLTTVAVPLMLWVPAAAATAQENPLTCLQQPIAWFVGQQNRIVIGTPADCGELQVSFPQALELFDRWPWQQGDTTQRFYFRALAPLDAGTIRFACGQYSLDLPVQVLTWPQALERRRFENWDLPRIFPMEGEDEHKSGLSFLDPQELEAMREQGQVNVDAILAGLPDDETLYYRLGESTIPRAVFVQYTDPRGCPVCGRKIFEGRSAFYPWIIDPEEHPWKVGCPECGRWFPSNDFAAGDMHSGEFPDDGWGYFKPGEQYPYAFIAYYASWYYTSHHVARIRDLALAYARSGDRRLAKAATLMMFRTAEQYLNLAVNLNMRKALTRSSVWAGRIVPQTDIPIVNTWLYIEHNWEVPRHGMMCEAFEQLWDYLNGEDPELIAFLQAQHHPEIRTMEDVRNFIETSYFRTVAQACVDKNLIGNLPQGQLATVNSALLLNTQRSRDLVDWALTGGGQLSYFLTNAYFIEGSAFESQGYNAGHVTNFQEIGNVLDRIAKLNPDVYGEGGVPVLTEDPQYRQLYDFCLNFNLIGRTHAQTGDSGDVCGTDPYPRNLTTDVAPQWFIQPFAQIGDWRYALPLWNPDTGQPISQVTDPELRRRIAAVVAEHGPDLEQPSNVCDGYGHTILRAGSGDDRRAVWIRYGRARGHAHDDMLTIGFEGLRRKLLPELGYPHSWNWRGVWEGNWATHYCTRIEGSQARSRGHCTLMADGPWARVTVAAAPAHYDIDPPACYELLPDQRTERMLALIDLDERTSYAVDLTTVRGGSSHWWSFHGPRTEGVTVEGLELQPQDGGTVAGPDVPYGEGGQWQEEHKDLAALSYMYDVARATTDRRWALDWPLQGYPQVHVRMTALPLTETAIALAKGKPPGGGKPYELDWAIAHVEGAEPLTSRFLDVIECYEDERPISSIEPVKAGEGAVALRVRSGERTDLIVYNPQRAPVEADGVATDGLFAVWREVDGAPEALYLVGGTSLRRGGASLQAEAGQWRGVISAADYPERRVIITPAAAYPTALVGRYVRFTNGMSDCIHLITAAENQGDATVLTLELDPRIGEGPVASAQDGRLVSGTTLYLAGLRYYHGKTLANETGSATYRLSGVTGKESIWIDPERHGSVGAAQLAEQFVDADGDGVNRFLIYDYGVGDETTLTFALSLQRQADGSWRAVTPVSATLSLPGAEPIVLTPGP